MVDRCTLTAGRYPWAAGFYNMNADTDHCTVNSTALPEMLKPLGCERSSTPCDTAQQPAASSSHR
jgi:hypothetical protein